MKSITHAILIPFFLLITTNSFAQKPVIGLRLGANIYQNEGLHLQNKYHGNIILGGYLGLKSDKYSITAEGLFTQSEIVMGDDFNEIYKDYLSQGGNKIKNGRIQTQEIGIPVLLGLKIINSVWFQIGPQFTSVVNYKDKDSILKETNAVFKNGYVSGVLGLTVKLPFHLNATGRYIFGISNRDNTNIDDKWTTNHFQLLVGFGLF